ncbi:hypothetical protein BKA60DRAFT_344313 [Fusarium oxysporum]|nr:hypothetical protein BKA60DRAFT_344313 [Fusarium oxysporum]
MLCFALALDLVMRLVFFSLRVFAMFLFATLLLLCQHGLPRSSGNSDVEAGQNLFFDQLTHSILFWINTDSRERWRRDEQMKDGECMHGFDGNSALNRAQARASVPLTTYGHRAGQKQ